MIAAGLLASARVQLKGEIRLWDPATLAELARRWPHGEISDVRVEPAGLERIFRDLSQGAGR